MNTICGTCRNLDAACQIEGRKRKRIGDNTEPPRVLFSIRKEDLRISSEAGCHFCSVLLRVLAHLPEQWTSADRGSFQLDSTASVRASFSQSSLSVSSFRKHEFEIYAPEGECFMVDTTILLLIGFQAIPRHGHICVFFETSTPILRQRLRYLSFRTCWMTASNTMFNADNQQHNYPNASLISETRLTW